MITGMVGESMQEIRESGKGKLKLGLDLKDRGRHREINDNLITGN